MFNHNLQIDKFKNQLRLFSTENFNNFGDPKKHTTLEEHNPEVISLFVGCLLGDASATRGRVLKSVKLKNTLIRFGQSEKNGMYLQSIKDFLVVRNYAANSSLKIKKTYDKRTNKTYFSSSFATFSFKSLNKLHSLFYREANDLDRQKGRGNERFIKIIPTDIAKYLTPKALAYWYMDDGSFHIYGGTSTFCTHSFTKQEVELLIITLQNVFNLKTTLRKAHSFKEQYSIIIPKSEMPHFILLVKPYMVPSMFYKLGLDSDENVILLKKAEVNPLSLKPAMRRKTTTEDFTEEIFSLFYGNLLCSASVEPTNKSSSIRFRMQGQLFFHAKKMHQKLILENCCKNKELKLYTLKDRKPFVRFGTFSFESLNDLYSLFYPQGKQKVVPKNIQELLTPLAIAYWAVGAGHFKKQTISTICSTEKEVLYLQEALENKFNICSNPKFNFPKPFCYRLCFSDSEWKKVIEIIQKELGNEIFEQWCQLSHTS